MAPQLFDLKVTFEVAKSAPGGVAGGIYIGGVRWFEFSLRIYFYVFVCICFAYLVFVLLRLQLQKENKLSSMQPLK